MGSVVLVTALQVTALLFALPIYARLTHHRVTRWEWMWAVVLAGALAVVIIVGDPASGQQRGSLATWLIVAAGDGPGIGVVRAGGAGLVRRPVAAVLLAVVAGSSLALFAVLTKGVVEVAEDGFGAVLRAPEFYPWLLVALCGMIFQQSAFRAGALTASLPTMTVAKPVVAGALGITVLGETLDARGPEACCAGRGGGRGDRRDGCAGPRRGRHDGGRGRGATVTERLARMLARRRPGPGGCRSGQTPR